MESPAHAAVRSAVTTFKTHPVCRGWPDGRPDVAAPHAAGGVRCRLDRDAGSAGYGTGPRPDSGAATGSTGAPSGIAYPGASGRRNPVGGSGIASGSSPTWGLNTSFLGPTRQIAEGEKVRVEVTDKPGEAAAVAIDAQLPDAPGSSAQVRVRRCGR